jgi:hypothetical protein
MTQKVEGKLLDLRDMKLHEGWSRCVVEGRGQRPVKDTSKRETRTTKDRDRVGGILYFEGLTPSGRYRC